MKVLKATEAQYEKLNGYTNGQNVLSFIKDVNDNWIVGLGVLNNPSFEAIRGDLEALRVVNHYPIHADD